MSATTSSSNLLEQNLAAAVQEGKIPHAVVFATDRDGVYKNEEIANDNFDVLIHTVKATEMR